MTFRNVVRDLLRGFIIKSVELNGFLLFILHFLQVEQIQLCSTDYYNIFIQMTYMKKGKSQCSPA